MSDLAEARDSLADAIDVDDIPEIVDPSHADRLLFVLGRLRDDDAGDQEVADAQLTRVRGWLEGRRATRDTRREELEGILARWHQFRLAVDPKVKTISLPNGQLKARARSASLVFDDSFLVWADVALPAAVRVTKSVDRAEAKRLLGIVDADGVPTAVDLATGETPPGVTVSPPGVTFSVVVA